MSGRHRSALGYVVITITVMYFVLNIIGAKHYLLPATDSKNIVANGYVDVAILIAFILNAIAFLIWLYRCFKNIESRKGVQRITSAGAVYWWFVPIAFFWKPYEAVKIVVDDVDGAGWLKNDLSIWWASWIAANLGGYLIPEIGQLILGSAHEDLVMAAIYGLEALSAFYFLKVVDAMMGGTMMFHGWGYKPAR